MPQSPWDEFVADPRDPAHHDLRASDADRNVAARILGEAYADGRLDRGEFDERNDAVSRARRLGELPALLQDLVVPRPPAGGLVRAGSGHLPVTADVHAQAVAAWERDRREALLQFLVPTVITWVIWSIVMPGDFPWPAIVTVATAVPLIQTLIRKVDMIADHEKSLVRKAEKRRRAEERRLETGETDEGPPQLEQ